MPVPSAAMKAGQPSVTVAAPSSVFATSVSSASAASPASASALSASAAFRIGEEANSSDSDDGVRGWDDMPIARSLMESGKRYIAERIIDETYSDDGREFLVKWKGYSEAEATWESDDHIQRTAEHLVKHWDTYGS